ncbi:MAG: N-6 DNA methylase, partial [Bacteroidota bacterium]
DYFSDPAAALALFRDIPFLNGGLFECLDHEEVVKGKVACVRIDGFSDREDNALHVPNELFFTHGEWKKLDLNEDYGTKGKKFEVRGLLDILHSYKFTIDENTPIEEEIALDPELLGHVFENLLASYNPETESTARKETGSFYTPREVVDYMVSESLIAYMENALTVASEKNEKKNSEVEDSPTTNKRLHELFAYSNEPHSFSQKEVHTLIDAIDSLKIIDPACGSGAFPMGILHRLVFILTKLDPGNEEWKERQINKALELEDVESRELAVHGIQEAFERNNLNFGRKLYLIQNGIYGVDIQPIAVQIAKLRFFISLVVDQRIDDDADNHGIRPLPNLETKFVAADSLLQPELHLGTQEVYGIEDKLRKVRNGHFSARTPGTKEKYRKEDAELREELAKALRDSGMTVEASAKVAHWNPYAQNASADFFDPEWMFGVKGGFDIVIANPPYVRHEKIKEQKPVLQKNYTCYVGTADLYVYFFEQSLNMLKAGGILTFISSNKYFRAGYGEKLRRLLATKTTIEFLIDFGDAPVFKAIAYPSIIVTRKVPPSGGGAQVLTWKPGPRIEDFGAVFAEQSFTLARNELTHDSWKLESPAVLRLLEKLRRAGT